MKTKLIIEVETKDDYEVHEDCDKTEEDYTKEELEKYRKEYTEGLHKAIVEYLKKSLKDDVADHFWDSGKGDEYIIEDWDDSDYGIKINAEAKKELN